MIELKANCNHEFGKIFEDGAFLLLGHGGASQLRGALAHCLSEPFQHDRDLLLLIRGVEELPHVLVTVDKEEEQRLVITEDVTTAASDGRNRSIRIEIDVWLAQVILLETIDE